MKLILEISPFLSISITKKNIGLFNNYPPKYLLDQYSFRKDIDVKIQAFLL